MRWAAVLWVLLRGASGGLRVRRLAACLLCAVRLAAAPASALPPALLAAAEMEAPQKRASATADDAAQRIALQQVESARERALTLTAYLDEMEWNIVKGEWARVLVYAYTFAEQDSAFVALTDGLFPSADSLDTATRAALTYEAREMFLAIDQLIDAAKACDFPLAQRAYTKLALNYDHFLKAGNLYPTYDPITSTEVFFANTPPESLRYQQSAPQLLDRVLVLKGPDMGKTGSLLLVEPDSQFAIVKLDKNGRAYAEIKAVKLRNLGKAQDQSNGLRSPPLHSVNLNRLNSLR